MEGGVKWIEVTPGIWENAETGGRVILNGAGKVAAILSKKQVEYERKGIEAIGANASAGKGTSANVTKAIVNDVPEVTQTETNNASNVLTKLWNREGVSEATKNSFTKLAEEEGGMLTASQMMAALGLGIGGLTLGPTAFKIGVDLGNGLDELLGFPTWSIYEKEQAPSSGGYHLKFCQSTPEKPEKLKAEKRELACPPPPGATYVTYRGDAIAVEDEWSETKEYYNFIGSEGKKGEEVEGKTIYGGYPSNYVERAWFYAVCAGNALPIEFGGTGTCKPETNPGIAEFPQTGPLSSAQESENKAHGVASHPVVAPPEVKREPHITPRKHAKWWWEEEEGVAHPSPEEVNKILKEHEDGKELKSMPESELEPGPKFMEKNAIEPESSPEAEGHTEPSAPLTSTPTVPAIEWPKITSPCNVFPFGVPCWLVARLGEFVSGMKTPKFEAKLPAGVKMKIDFVWMAGLMEIVRAVEIVLGTIAAVLFFGRFASSSSGSSGGGGGDD